MARGKINRHIEGWIRRGNSAQEYILITGVLPRPAFDPIPSANKSGNLVGRGGRSGRQTDGGWKNG